MQEFEKTPIDGLVLVQRKIFKDDRGFFTERIKRSDLGKAGLPTTFVQENHSRSFAGVLRGLHYQYHPAQGKLVGVTRGKIWDVAIDIRADSPTFGQSYGVELSDENGLLLWIPAGFAHGFCVTGEEPADVIYQTTAEYEPATEGGIIWNDPDLAIDWPIERPQLSQRDLELPTFADYRRNPPVWQE